MYSIDGNDKVVELNEMPQSSVGAPIPVVLSVESKTVVAYYIQDNELDFESEFEPIAIISFEGCRSTMFGPPNDETFSGHPLYSKGLRPYSAFIIENSSWLRKLIEMNSVHPYHNETQFNDYKHYVLSFHDSTFECIAESYSIEIVNDTILNVINLMKEKINF
ncbi:hypothetical protein V7150_22270 [Neobacillus drentensis]|uniref:hypothetical protein n=1 Tax=Neobacillus drentensis TaxID=220684 RepID=UPI002FFF0F38